MGDVTINGLTTAHGLWKTIEREPAQGFDKIMQDAIGKLYQIQNDAEKAAANLLGIPLGLLSTAPPEI